MKNTKTDARFELISKKADSFKDIIIKTTLSLQKYKILDIISSSDINNSIDSLNETNILLDKIKSKTYNKTSSTKIDNIINDLQEINNNIALIFKNYGTENINDLIKICVGNEFNKILKETDDNNKYKLISKYFHPISYKTIDIETPDIYENENKNDNRSIFCYDLSINSNNFQIKVYGIKILFKLSSNKNLEVNGIIDDVNINLLDNELILHKLQNLKDNIITNNMTDDKTADKTSEFNRYINSLSLKELLIYNTQELYEKYIGYMSNLTLIKQKPLSLLINEFISNDLYNQRHTIYLLLLKENNPEFKYLAYLLYDLLSNDTNGTVDTFEQTILYDSFPWDIKKNFRNAMKDTVKYTNELANFDHNKIPLEQQICLLKVPDTVKEKAMSKLKEVKTKEDTGSKARQYLEGLLKIPFGIYRKEKILTVKNDIQNEFKLYLNKCIEVYDIENNYIVKKDIYTNIEIKKYVKYIHDNYINNLDNIIVSRFIRKINTFKRNELINAILELNLFIKMNFIKCNHINGNIKYNKLTYSGLKIPAIKNNIINFVNTFNHHPNISSTLNYIILTDKNSFQVIYKHEKNIYENLESLKSYMLCVNNTLNDAVYGHERAKRQIERIIGQWINGDNKGYCFGFEGPPGIGKTSLAKNGLSKCLIDEDGSTRPFSLIAMGGSSNGTILEGHSYTYVGSNWGKIVDILMDKKIMNPIIFIDELDKVSRTEQGKEIIGILTHLIDSTQNNSFQDKYFSGVEIDLSKVLFIFSYNDVDLIDKILLDRIHRIKFDILTLEDKITISKKYILPELFETIGLNDIIQIPDNVIEYVIETYTNEPGVRKLKEILFEIISEINLEILNNETDYDIPIIITQHNITDKYLKKHSEITHTSIHDNSTIGIINGLWANSIGCGGIIPIQVNFFPSSTYLELKLTGMQGDVMKESMNVAKTIAFTLPIWNLDNNTDNNNDNDNNNDHKQISYKEQFKDCGIHIHCPEGATPKDGPSAGCAITLALYSVIHNIKIKNNIGVTGEITLQGDITKIGGLELKLLGGIRGGITEFIVPEQNKKDYNNFIERHSNYTDVKIHFIKHITDAFPLVYVY